MKAGRIRHKLAKLICNLTGCLVDPHQIERTNPYERLYYDVVAWSCWAQKPDGGHLHVFSWDTMTDCAKHGIEIVTDHRNNNWEMEVCHK